MTRESYTRSVKPLPSALAGTLPPWAAVVHGDDPRFADLLPSGASVAELVSTFEGRIRLAEVAEVLLARVDRIARLPVEKLMLDYLAALRTRQPGRNGQRPLPPIATKEEWTLPLVARLGLGGDPPTTLEEASRLIGCTRERVRQVETKLLARRPSRPVWLPALESALEKLAAAAPLLETEVGSLLAAEGLAAPTMTGASLLAAANFGGVDLSLRTPEGLKVVGRWVVTDADAAVVSAPQIAARHTSTYGLTTMQEIVLALRTNDCEVDPDDVQRVLRDDPRVRFTSDRWLWVDKADYASPYSNSLRNAARAILSVNSPQTIASIHEGFRRSQRFRQRDVIPSRVAVGEFLAAHPEFFVKGEEVRPVELLDYHEVLGPVAAQVIDVLKASPYGVMDRMSMYEAVTETGVSQATITVWTTYAEWLEHFAPNIWGLRGEKVSPAIVEALQEAAKRRSANEPHERGWFWTPEGTIALVARVTTSFRQTGVITMDAELQKLIGGRRFSARGPHGPVGEIAAGDDHLWVWGWGPFLRRTGVQVGQVVRAEFDLTANTVRLSVGGAELLASIAY